MLFRQRERKTRTVSQITLGANLSTVRGNNVAANYWPQVHPALFERTRFASAVELRKDVR